MTRYKVKALSYSMRQEVCDHRHMPYSGKVPCTGSWVCTMCGVTDDQLAAEASRAIADDEAKLTTWNINGVEFEAMTFRDPRYTGKLPYGVVRDPNDSSLFYFTAASFDNTELDQLIEEGYLVCGDRYLPRDALPSQPLRFCVRVALSDRGRFYLVEGNPEVATCCICSRDFPFIDDGYNVIQTHPGTGPSYSCGGTPPDYDAACTTCIESHPEDDYDEGDF